MLSKHCTCVPHSDRRCCCRFSCFPNTALVSHTLTAGAAAGLLDTALLHPGVRGSVRGGAGQVLVLCLEHLRPCVLVANALGKVRGGHLGDLTTALCLHLTRHRVLAGQRGQHGLHLPGLGLLDLTLLRHDVKIFLQCSAGFHHGVYGVTHYHYQDTETKHHHSMKQQNQQRIQHCSHHHVHSTYTYSVTKICCCLCSLSVTPQIDKSNQLCLCKYNKECGVESVIYSAIWFRISVNFFGIPVPDIPCL